MSGGGTRLALAVGAALLLAGCVTPTPPPGEPIPAIALTADQSDPVAGALSITATPSNFSPTAIEFRLDDLGSSPLVVDTTPPFTVTIDTTTVSRGKHTVFATGRDDRYTVWQLISFTTRPNFVVVMVDDMDALTMPLWDALPKTKAAIGDHGTTFANAFAPDPICCPARGTFLTGDYAHNNGTLAGGYAGFVSSGAENDTVATRLRDAGYRTAFTGKYLNGYEGDPSVVPPGWDEWFGLAGNIHFGYDYQANHNGVIESFGSSDADHQTDVLAARSASFLHVTEADDNQPFFLLVAPHAPHDWIPPARRHAINPFTDDALPTRANFDEADVSDKSEWLRLGVPPLSVDALTKLRNGYRRMMGSMLAVDDLVASLVDTLKMNGEYESTVLVFTSDNGYNFGAHRLRHKMVPYEESIRVPFVMAGPGVPSRVEPAMVAQLDLAPTLLDFAGVEVPDAVDGRSLRTLFESGADEWRTDLLLEHSGNYGLFLVYDTLAQVRAHIAAGVEIFVPTYRALRTERHLYVEWYGGSEHEYELYDVVADPLEMTNLLSTPEGEQANAALRAQLHARMETLSTCSGPSCRT